MALVGGLMIDLRGLPHLFWKKRDETVCRLRLERIDTLDLG